MSSFKGKTIILGIPQFFSLHEAWIKQLHHLGFVVIDISLSYDKFRYKHLGQRLYNTFRKLVLNDREYKSRLKQRTEHERIAKILNQTQTSDYALFIRPDLYPMDIVRKANSISKQSIGYQWDGVNRFPNVRTYIPFFDRFFVFDPADANVPNVAPVTNFYFDYKKNNRDHDKTSDLFFIGTYLEDRMSDVYRFFNIIDPNILKTEALLQMTDISLIETVQDQCPLLKVIKQSISYDENLDYILNTEVIVDFANKSHQGLSLRVFEALGHDKKLITTNQTIKDYDFYQPNNILVLDDHYSFETVYTFMRSPYKPLTPILKEKYSFTNWLKYVLEVDGHIPISLPQIAAN